jgi:hypothetical protein
MKTKRKSLYSPHPGIAMVQKWIVDLPEKTGHSLEEWLTIIDEQGPATEKERRAWLKEHHKLGTNGAGWLAERSVGKGLEENDPELYLQAAERYVADMFAGKNLALKPIYDALLKLGLGLAGDVKACPCTTIVPLYRKHVFAQIKPATNTRIDMGFALKVIGKLETCRHDITYRRAHNRFSRFSCHRNMEQATCRAPRSQFRFAPACPCSDGRSTKKRTSGPTSTGPARSSPKSPTTMNSSSSTTAAPTRPGM